MKKFIIFTFAIACALILFYLVASPIKNAVSALLSGLFPLLLAVVLAYFLNHAVSFFEKTFLFIKKEKFRRLLSVIVGILAVLLVLVGLLFLFLPALIENVTNFTENFGGYFKKIQAVATDIDNALNLNGDFSLASLVAGFDLSQISSLTDKLTQSAMNFLSSFSVAVVLAVLILLEKDNIFAVINKLTDRIFSQSARIKRGASCTLVIIDGYVLGKFIEGALAGLFFTLFYYIVGIPYAYLFGFLMGLLFIIPYVGGYVALVPALLVALDISKTTALIVLLVRIILLNVLGSVISPIIFKNKLKVSALTIMSSVVVGGTAFGILGFLLSPPIVATIKAYFSVFVKTKPDKSQ